MRCAIFLFGVITVLCLFINFTITSESVLFLLSLMGIIFGFNNIALSTLFGSSYTKRLYETIQGDKRNIHTLRDYLLCGSYISIATATLLFILYLGMGSGEYHRLDAVAVWGVTWISLASSVIAGMVVTSGFLWFLIFRHLAYAMVDEAQN